MNEEYKFIPTDPEDVIMWLTATYEEIMGVTVQPASPERHFIQWMAEAIVLERVLTNYAANQNIPSRAVGENLDALAELFYEKKRPQAKAATCKMDDFRKDVAAELGRNPADSFDPAKAGTYTVMAGAGLSVRVGAGTDKAELGTLAKGAQAVCDGHYCTVGSVDWLLVAAGSITGYASAAYLKAGAVPAVNGSSDSNTKEDDDMVIYKTLNDVPSWYRPAVKKAVDKGALNGTGDGINVSEDLCRTLTVLDRLGKLD